MDELVQLYTNQITKGCGDRECIQPFCKNNQARRRTFYGRTVTQPIAEILATHLAASDAYDGLCQRLRPGSNSTDLNRQGEKEGSVVINSSASTAYHYTTNNNITRSGLIRPCSARSENALPHQIHIRRPTNALAYAQEAMSISSGQPLPENGFKAPYDYVRYLQKMDDQSFAELLAHFGKTFAADTPQTIPLARANLHWLKLCWLACERMDPRPPLDLIYTRLQRLMLVVIISQSIHFSHFALLPMLPIDVYKHASLLTSGQSGQAISKTNDDAITIRKYMAAKLLARWPVGATQAFVPQAVKTILLTHRDASFGDTGLNGDIAMSSFGCSVIVSFFRRNLDVPRLLSSAETKQSLGPRLSPFALSNPKSIVSMNITQMTGVLPTHLRFVLFRYACLRQMDLQIRNLNNVEKYLSLLQVLTSRSFTRRLPPALQSVHYFVIHAQRHDFLRSIVRGLSGALLIEGLIKRPLRVRFGVGEQLAVDQGGVQVEFFQTFGYELVHSAHGLFKCADKVAWFNPGYGDQPSVYEYIGIWFGIGVYNGCMIDIRFPVLLYRYLTSGKFEPTLEDFREIDPVSAKSLFSLETFSAPQLENLDIPFTFSFERDTGEIATLDLPSKCLYSVVTKDNVSTYIKEYVQCSIETSIRPFAEAFYRGFKFVISPELRSLVSEKELQLMVEGTGEISVADLRKYCTYEGYTADSPVIKYLWQVVEEFSHQEKQQLLEFVTGSRRVPIGGVSKLDFIIQRNGTDTSRLPSSAVCFSRLLLPDYSSKEELRHMLLLALQHSKGFGLI